MKRVPFYLLILNLVPSIEATYVAYIAGNGNDDCSGEFAGPLADGSAEPLATLFAARERGREHLAERTRSLGEVIVSIRGRRCPVSLTLELVPEDSGMAVAQVTWQAFPGEPDFTVHQIGEVSAAEVLAGNLLHEMDPPPHLMENGGIRLELEQLPWGTGFHPIPLERIGLQKTASRAQP